MRSAGLPSLMISNGIIASMRLAREGLTLLYPEYLQYTAELDMVCFDKTGTLTHRRVSASFYMIFLCLPVVPLSCRMLAVGCSYCSNMTRYTSRCMSLALPVVCAWHCKAAVGVYTNQSAQCDIRVQ